MNRRKALLGLWALLYGCVGPDGEGRSPAPAPIPAPTQLPRTIWAPRDRPRAVVLALHGFNDYRRTFMFFGPWAAARGIWVEAYDQRGFGENPDRGLWAGSGVLIADAIANLEALRQRHPGLPVHLLGTSMGAAVATLTAGQAPALADSVILCAPAVWGGDAMNPLYRVALWVAAQLAPDLMVTGESLGRQASDNLEVLRALARDPLFIRQTRLRTLAGLVSLMGEAWEAASGLKIPALVLIGARDQIIPVSVQLAFAARIRAERCTRVVYPAGWHLLLRDLQRERVYRDIEAWLEGRPLPSGLGQPCGEGRLATTDGAAEIAGIPRRQ